MTVGFRLLFAPVPALSELMSDPWLGLAVLAIAAAVAGVINTIAGGGSFLILPLLIAFGVPASMANGTVRVGVLVQNISAGITFHRQGFRDYAVLGRLIGPVLVGTALGTWAATQLSDAVARPLFGGALVMWAVVLVLRPGRFSEPPAQPSPFRWWSYLGAFGIGLYGGFLHAGVGFPILALLVSIHGFAAVRANAIKVALVLAYTAVALPLFAMADLVAWREGAALAAGAMVGGWIGTRWQVKIGAAIVRWVLVITVAIAGVAMLLA